MSEGGAPIQPCACDTCTEGCDNWTDCCHAVFCCPCLFGVTFARSRHAAACGPPCVAHAAGLAMTFSSFPLFYCSFLPCIQGCATYKLAKDLDPQFTPSNNWLCMLGCESLFCFPCVPFRNYALAKDALEPGGLGDCFPSDSTYSVSVSAMPRAHKETSAFALRLPPNLMGL